MESQLEEMKEDLDNEKTLKARAEKTKRELTNELETLRNEYIDATDKTAVSLEIQKKKDEELRDLKVFILLYLNLDILIFKQFIMVFKFSVLWIQLSHLERQRWMK